MASGYWARVTKRAWADTLHALGLETTDKVVVRLLTAIVSVAAVWLVLGSTATGLSIVARAFAALSVLLIFPAIFVWKFITAPSKMDAELSSQLKVEADEATKQKAIDDIADEIKFAVDNLINPTPFPTSTGDPDGECRRLQTKVDDWVSRVSSKLADRSIFTKGDQIHFDSLGSIELLMRYGHPKLDWLHSMLVLRLDRLREIEQRARSR